MNPGMLTDYWKLYAGWSRTLTSIACGPWQLLARQYDAGIGVLDSMLAALKGERASQPARPAALSEVAALERAALDRVRQGLSPPREIYAAPNRDRINWARFPDWARPSDPELFEGCAHEG
jgi:hypothetical protein